MTRQEMNLCIIIGVMFLICFVSGWLIEFFDKKSLKAEQHEYRHRNDEDKQQATDSIERAYQELIIKEIMK